MALNDEEIAINSQTLLSGNEPGLLAYYPLNLHILSNDGGTGTGIKVGDTATDGNWHHVAMTWKRNTDNGFVSYYYEQGSLYTGLYTADLV